MHVYTYVHAISGVGLRSARGYNVIQKKKEKIDRGDTILSYNIVEHNGAPGETKRTNYSDSTQNSNYSVFVSGRYKGNVGVQLAQFNNKTVISVPGTVLYIV